MRIEEAVEVLAVAAFLPRVTSGCGFIGFLCPHCLEGDETLEERPSWTLGHSRNR